MIKSAQQYQLSEIFQNERDVKYVIPRYQREYTWGKDNWEELLDDIQESEGDHFIGSLICIDRGNDTFAVPELEIVDGQQRLTTISILYAAIYEKLKSLAPSDDLDIQNDIYNLRHRLVLRSNRGELRLSPSQQNFNLNDYSSILRDIGVVDVAQDVQNKGNRQIYRSFRFYRTKLENFTIEALLSLLSQINKVLVVKIEVNSHSDAFVLFESLNNRGVPLSAIDLIKNKLLAELERKEHVSIDVAFGKWRQMVENLPTYPIQERFLRHFYNAYKSDCTIKVDGMTRATRSNVIKIYETLIERDPEAIFDRMYEKSRIYHDLLSPNEENYIVSDKFDAELIDLVNVQAAPSYALLLYLFSECGPHEESFLRDTVNLLTKYFIRRNLTDFPGTRNLDQIFIDLIDEFTVNPANRNTAFIVQFLTTPERFANVDMLTDRLNGNMYELNTDTTRFLLTKIEERQTATRERKTDFWERDKSNKLVWTIEHIFPEGSNIPASWTNMIAGGDAEKARMLQAKYVHKLGNLTLTGYNASLSNFEFEKKRDRTDKSGRHIGYRNGLFLNRGLAEADTWTIEDIEERTAKLVTEALTLLTVEGED